MTVAVSTAPSLGAEQKTISVLSTDPGAWPTAEELQTLLHLGLAFGSAALALSLALPLVVKPVLRRLGVVDIPNERSSHTRTVIRGMGLAVAAAVVVVQLLALLLGAVEVDRSVALVVLLGTAYWGGMMDWLGGTVLEAGMIGPDDLDRLILTDDPAEAVQAIRTYEQPEVLRP